MPVCEIKRMYMLGAELAPQAPKEPASTLKQGGQSLEQPASKGGQDSLHLQGGPVGLPHMTTVCEDSHQVQAALASGPGLPGAFVTPTLIQQLPLSIFSISPAKWLPTCLSLHLHMKNGSLIANKFSESVLN